jgi:hypothetical protein
MGFGAPSDRAMIFVRSLGVRSRIDRRCFMPPVP